MKPSPIILYLILVSIGFHQINSDQEIECEFIEKTQEFEARIDCPDSELPGSTTQGIIVFDHGDNISETDRKEMRPKQVPLKMNDNSTRIKNSKTVVGRIKIRSAILTKRILSRFRHLHHLRISGRFEQIANGAFEGFYYLISLDLRRNALREISTDFFRSLPSLEKLNLRSNRLNGEFLEHIGEMYLLRELDISFNNMITIGNPDKTYFLPFLRILQMEGNSIDLSDLSRLMVRFSWLDALEINSDANLADIFRTLIHSEYLTNITILGSSSDTFDTVLLTTTPMLLSLQIAKGRLREIPGGTEQTDTKIQVLALNDNRIFSILAGDLKKWRKLTILNLENNDIHEIEANAFSALTHLQELYLGLNFIRSLTPGHFVGLANLNILSLSNNELTEFGLDLLNEVTRLNTVDLYANKIKSITLRNDRVVKVDKVFVIKVGIEYIVFDTTNSMFALQTLRSSNRLIPASMNDALKSFGYDHPHPGTNTVNLFQTIRFLTTLDSADFANQSITELFEADFQNLKSVKFICLNSNEIRKIVPKTFSNLKQLEGLDISVNRISDISEPQAFEGLKQLIYLNLAHNQISEIPETLIGELPNLILFDLSFNSIKSIDVQLMKQMNRLGQVYIKGNDLMLLHGF